MGGSKRKPDSWRVPIRWERCANCKYAKVIKKTNYHSKVYVCNKFFFKTEPRAICDDFQFTTEREHVRR